nr:uncharacterized protein LOC128698126 [Cherax quadricarinatus]
MTLSRFVPIPRWTEVSPIGTAASRCRHHATPLPPPLLLGEGGVYPGDEDNNARTSFSRQETIEKSPTDSEGRLDITRCHCDDSRKRKHRLPQERPVEDGNSSSDIEEPMKKEPDLDNDETQSLPSCQSDDLVVDLSTLATAQSDDSVEVTAAAGAEVLNKLPTLKRTLTTSRRRKGKPPT